MANIQAIVRAALFTPGVNGRWGLALNVEGVPGTGKTAELNSIAGECGLHMETVLASVREPSDFLGLPIVADGGRTVYAPPAWAEKVAKLGRAVVFFDEMNTAPPSVQAALLRVVLEGVVGDCTLPPGIRFIAAQNAVEDAAGGWDLALPLANRFGHLGWAAPDVSAWTRYMLEAVDTAPAARGSAEGEEARVMAAWSKPWATVRGEVTGFLRSRPDLLHKMPRHGAAQASKAWPSPRSWEMATRARASGIVHRMNAVDADEFMSAFIGGAAAAEFEQWRLKADLPDPADVLDDKVEFVHDPRRLDRTAAVLGGCAAMVTPESAPKRIARTTVLWSIIVDLIDKAPDVTEPTARALVRAKLALNIPTGTRALTRLQPILVAAGVNAR